jgi:hypothetical protein
MTSACTLDAFTLPNLVAGNPADVAALLEMHSQRIVGTTMQPRMTHRRSVDAAIAGQRCDGAFPFDAKDGATAPLHDSRRVSSEFGAIHSALLGPLADRLIQRP